MPQPPAYVRTKDFTENFGSETDHSALNSELDAAGNSINDIRSNLAVLQADDGKLRPAVVTPDSISPALRTDLVNRVVLDSQQLLADAQAAALSAEADANTATTKASEAVVSANTASAKAALATTSANDAANSATTSATKRDEAVTAKDTAVGARDTAVGAANTATTKRDEAVAAATTATTKRDEALIARDTAVTKAGEASASATAATNAAATATTKAQEAADSAASIDSASLARLSNLGWRNRIINGNFAINQRVVSGAVTLAAGAYGHDRWKAGSGGCTYTFATNGIDTVVTITAGSLMQVIENKNIEGGTYRLSHAGTAQARVAVSGGATSGPYAAAPFTTAAATANQTVTVEFTAGTVSKVMLEPGSSETTFERMPYGLELAQCQRYYCKTFDATVRPAQNSANFNGALFGSSSVSNVSFSSTWKFPVEMRVPPPTIATYSPTLANANWSDQSGAVPTATILSTGTSSVSIRGTTAVAAGGAHSIHITADAEL